MAGMVSATTDSNEVFMKTTFGTFVAITLILVNQALAAQSNDDYESYPIKQTESFTKSINFMSEKGRYKHIDAVKYIVRDGVQILEAEYKDVNALVVISERTIRVKSTEADCQISYTEVNTQNCEIKVNYKNGDEYLYSYRLQTDPQSGEPVLLIDNKLEVYKYLNPLTE